MTRPFCQCGAVEHLKGCRHGPRTAYPYHADLLAEIIECLEMCIPEKWTLRYLLVNAEWYNDSYNPGGVEQLKYQYGRLLGCAEWEGCSVESLLTKYDLWPECCDNPNCDNRGSEEPESKRP